MLRLGLAALVVVILLSGCLAPAVSPAATKDAGLADAPRPDVAVPKFLPPVALGSVFLGTEPNVYAHGPHVYVTTPLSLWRSDDSGKSWKALGKPECMQFVTLPAEPPACPWDSKNPGLVGPNDGSIVTTRDGRLFWAGLTPGVPVQYSDDHGEAWSKYVDVANGNSSDREWLSVDKNDTVFVNWNDGGKRGDSNAKSQTVMRYSTDKGATWSPLEVVSEQHITGPLLPDTEHGVLLVPRIAKGHVDVARSTDMGKTWTPVAVAPTTFSSHWPVLAQDDAGTVYVTWMDYAGPLPRLGGTVPQVGGEADNMLDQPVAMLSYSKDLGLTWSKPVQVSPKDKAAVFPWIVAGAAGRVAIAWYEGEVATPVEGDRVPNLWHVGFVETSDADSDAPKLVHAYVNAQPVHVGTECYEGQLCLVAQDRSALDYFELRALADGTPVVAFGGDATVRYYSAEVYASVMTEGTKLR